MTSRQKHIEGFTLAEVLLAVAIILVLAALAFPSIISAQNNMRVLELDNAASRIADAAQVQMTAKKNAGTWMPLVKEDDSSGNRVYKSDFPPAVAQNPKDDLRYMTADTARREGIVPALAIDEQVRDGSYLIEFDASVAAVTRVLYTDGKSGFFGAPKKADGRVLAYYRDYGASPDSRSRRIAYEVMIGYHEGSAAGATQAKALDRPVIWMDGAGHLCVQDGNIAENPEWNTRLELTLTRKDASTPSFTLSGLGNNFSECAVTAQGENGQVYTGTFQRLELSTVITMTPKTDTAKANDVYSIDLNRLTALVKEDGARQGLYEILAQFAPSEDLLAEASLSIPEGEGAACVPASAKAFVQWPLKKTKLYLYVTDPAPAALPSHITGTFKAPETGLDVPDVKGLWNKTLPVSFPVKTSSAVLTNDNPEAAQQKYAGGYVELSEAVSSKAKIEARAGSYAAGAAARAHRYQIYEIWLSVANDAGGAAEGEAATASGFQRVGCLTENAWTWEDTAWGATFRECVALRGDSATEAGATVFTDVTVDSEKLYELMPVSEGSSGYMVYVRTTPRLDEVNAWFNDNMAEGYNFSQAVSATTTGSRGTNHGHVIRRPFEAEFGAPSTVALWQFTKAEGTSVKLSDKTGYPAAGSIRVYYSATPALAWGAGLYIDDTITNALPSAALWLYRKEGAAYVAQENALVRPARSGENFHLVASDSADFEIPYSDSSATINGVKYQFAGHDELFYRVFEYCDENGRPLAGYEAAYVPYLSQREEYANFKAYTQPVGQVFEGWEVWAGDAQVRDASGKALVVQPGQSPAAYDGALPFGSIQLRALSHFDYNDDVGLVYIGLDEGGQKTAYGYRAVESANAPATRHSMWDLVGSQVQVGSYYLVVPTGWFGDTLDVLSCTGSGFDRNRTSKLYLDGHYVKLYRLTATETPGAQATPVYFQTANAGTHTNLKSSREFLVNFNFANAVTLNADVANAWGGADRPWQVELAGQFPGALSSGAQAGYLGHAFRQTHDIDFSGYGAYPGFATGFSGAYDGEGNRIYAAERAVSSLQADGAYRGQANGLFPLAFGAALSNVNLVYGSSSEGGDRMLAFDDADNPVVCFGGLAGYAVDSVIEGCSVSSYGGTATVNLHSMRSAFEGPSADGYNVAGALVARTVRTSVSGCTARDIAFSLRTESGVWDTANSRNYFGGLVGVADIADFAADDQPLYDLSAQSVTLAAAGGVGQGKNVSLGGLFGRVWTGGKKFAIDASWEWRATDVRLAADLDLSRRQLSERLFVGSAIGNLAANGGATCAGLLENEGNEFSSELAGGAGSYERDLTAYGPLHGRIPAEDEWVDERVGLWYVDDEIDVDVWSAYGYAAGDAEPAAGTLAAVLQGKPPLERGGYYLTVPAGRTVVSSAQVKAEPVEGAYRVAGEERALFRLSLANDAGERFTQVRLTVEGGPDLPSTHAYYANFNFANALATDKAVASAWGTDASPWQVAMARQFPGALPAAAQRLGDRYRQTTDIGFIDLEREDGSVAYPGFAAAFTGVYDGQGYGINQFQHGMTGLKANGRVQQGLFPLARGAQLKNIELRLVKGAENVIEAADGVARFGCLVGSAEEGTMVEACAVTGLVFEGDAEVDRAVLTVNSLHHLCRDVGILAGSALGSQILGGTVSNVALDMRFKAGERAGGGNQLNLGGLAGRVANAGAVMASCQTRAVELAIDQLVKSSYIRSGGLIGLFENGATLNEDYRLDGRKTQMRADDVLITYAAGQPADRAVPTTGGIVGRWYGKDASGADGTVTVFNQIGKRFEDVRYRLGPGGAAVELGTWYGNGEGAIWPKNVVKAADNPVALADPAPAPAPAPDVQPGASDPATLPDSAPDPAIPTDPGPQVPPASGPPDPDSQAPPDPATPPVSAP